MIPLRRSTTKSLGTTLLSYSRQALPRPARLYSTPSTARHNAYLAESLPAQPELPPYMSKPAAKDDESITGDLHKFLRRDAPYTLLPTPLPSNYSSRLNDLYFTDSPTQDSLAVIDACLHNHYDVPRAKQIFETLRKRDKDGVVLTTRLYNSLLESFVAMATSRDKGDRLVWLEDAWILFGSMEAGTEAAAPDATTYAIMLITWLRFNPDSAHPVSPQDIEMREPSALLRGLVDRQIPVSHVVASRYVSSDQEAADIIRLLSKTAVNMNLVSVVGELSRTQTLGNSHLHDPLQDIPEARPVMKPKEYDPTSDEPLDPTDPNQQEVPFNLEVLRKHLGRLALARRVLPDDAATRQKLLEDSVYEEATERLKHQAEIFDKLGLGDGGLNNSHLQSWMWDWHKKLQRRLKSEIPEVIKEESLVEGKNKIGLGPFLSLVSPEKLSLIAILELMRLQGSGGVSEGMKTARALLTIGKAVEMEHRAEICRRNNITIPANNLQTGSNYFTKSGYKDLYAKRVAARNHMEDSEEWAADWTQTVRAKVGSFLVDALMDVAIVVRSRTIKGTGEVLTEEQPAFFHSYEYLRGHKLGVIRLNPEVAERMSRDGLRETLHPRQLPMLVKPKPWLSHDQGGYLYSRSSVMRFKESQEQQSYLKHASDKGNLELVYAGLDVLGSTPWQVNRRVFDVVLKVWNSGERMCKIPPAVYEVPEPEKPENYETDPKARSVYLLRQQSWSQGKASNHSDRCSVNYKIEIARAFLADKFYLPHNMDFRGRAYPIPPHLNHIGDDLSRGLLLFAEARPLGERGLRWLKIHLANLCGFDKGSFDERVQFVENHLADIYDSAERPLDGNMWWKKADDPWQCLAACMELRSALESPDPHAFASNFPVHQDGTCNGLQHYAALGGDSQGANQVNLGTAERPSDVYSYVAAMVQDRVKADAANQVKQAMLLEGKITRKVVKQTVMTTVYGVTFVGAREQIERQLKDRRDIPPEECWSAAAYLAKNVMDCIGDLFSGAKNIQAWLNLCAKLISKSIPPARNPSTLPPPSTKKKVSTQDQTKNEQMTAVVWTTPLGLPIVQPYRKNKKKQVSTSLQSVYISDPNAPATVNSMKQASAFPPNFIHSLDATHMMLTALECQTKGLTFASVHDSYWTHACSVDKMSAIIRDTFVALHSSNVLANLHKEFMARYKGYILPVSAIKAGNLFKQLAARGQTTSGDIVQSITGMGSEGAETTGPLTSTKDLLEALDLTLGSEEGLEGNEFQESESISAIGTEDDGKAEVGASTKRRRRTKKQIMDILAQSSTEEDPDQPNFVELTNLLPPVPKKGNFEVNTVKKSLYFFS